MKTKARDFSYKIRDRSLVLLLAGCLLLTPPIAAIFQLDIRIMGIPFTGLYLFLVWGLLIIGTAALSKPLQDSSEWDSSDSDSTHEKADSSD